MKWTRLALTTFLALGTIALAGCSNGGNNTVTGQTISGTITGFGSVYLNGVEYETAGASVTLDGSAGGETDLQVGMVVNVQGTPNPDGATGTASRITYADVVEGLILAVNLTHGTGTLNVMGQTVQVNELTIFDSNVPGITLDTITLNNMAEISGYTDGSGTIYATRVEIKQQTFQPGDLLELKGIISNLDSTAMTFRIGALVVDYSQATQLPGNLGNDLHVEVKGTTAPIDNGGTYTFVADQVEMFDDGDIGIGASEGDALHLQGVVTAIDAANRLLVINGQMMEVRADAMRNGLTLGDLSVGTYIKLEAEFTGSQWIVKEIEVGRNSDVELTSDIEAIDLAAGTITLLGNPIIIDGSTLLQDEISVNPQHYFDINDLQIGERVEVDVDSHTGEWIAAKLMREDPDNGAVLEGKVTSVTPVQVAGIEVVGLDALGITPALGMALKITGSWDGAQLTAATAILTQ